MPITRGSTPAAALATNAPSGSAPSSRARSSDAITSAAAPSLTPLAFPAVTVPSSRNAGFSAASFSAVVSGRGCSSTATSPTGTSSSAKRPASCAAAQRRCDSQRERVLVGARDEVALGDVLACLAHRLEREHRLQPRVREAPAEVRVVGDDVAARPRPVAPSSSRAARGSSTRRRPRRRGRPRPPRPRGTPRPPPTGPTRTAGSPSRPGTDCGSPASSTAMRATLRLSSPAWFAQPR